MNSLKDKFNKAEVIIDNEDIIDELLAEEELEKNIDLEKEAREAFKRISELDKLHELDSEILYKKLAEKSYKEAHFEFLSLQSKFMEFLATSTIATSDSLILAKWAWWTDTDKNRCLPILSAESRANEINKNFIFATTQKMKSYRNQFVNRFFGFAMGGVVALAFSIFGIKAFIGMSALGKTTFILFISSIVFTLFKGVLQNRVPFFGRIKQALIFSTIALMVGQYGHGLYLDKQKKAEAEKVMAGAKHDVAVTNVSAILNSLANNNKNLVNAYDSNKTAVASKLNVFLNSELEPLVKTILDNKQDLGTDYDSQVKKLVDVISEDTPVIKKLVADGIIQQSDAVAIQQKVNEQLGKL